MFPSADVPLPASSSGQLISPVLHHLPFLFIPALTLLPSADKYCVYLVFLLRRSRWFILSPSKMQKLVKAAKEGTKDGLEKTKAAVKKGRSFIKTKSFCHGMCHLYHWYVRLCNSCQVTRLCLSERKSVFLEDEESELFIEVDCFNVEPVLCPPPPGLSQQQVINTPFNFNPNFCNSFFFFFFCF